MRKNVKQKSVVTIVIAVLALCALAAGMAVAQEGAARPGMRTAPLSPAVPQGSAVRLTFQGRLTSADGSPVNVPVQVTFRIYTDVDPAVAPTAIWTSAERTVTPANGLFTVYLGDGSDPDLTDSIASQAAAISIQVAPDSEMTPRQPLNSVVGHSPSTGVDGSSTGGYGVHGSSPTSIGVYADSTSGTGMRADSETGTGVFGTSISATGVYGLSFAGIGVYGYSGNIAGYFEGVAPCCDSAGVRVVNHSSGVGLWASTIGNNAGLYGVGDGSGVVGEVAANGGIGVQGRLGPGVTSGYAGQFLGDVQITGNLSKGGGSFKIDHPLDPANQYLYHSFVESPDMMNIYNGNVTTDANGEAVIKLPDWFEALNRDFRYQLTPIGQFAQAIVLTEIAGNQFTIKTDKPNVKVSWQVTGIRHDPYADAHRIPVEETKPADERGKYLYPELYGQPESMGIAYDARLKAVQATEPISTTETGR
jgi:hypothetical protein